MVFQFPKSTRDFLQNCHARPTWSSSPCAALAALLPRAPSCVRHTASCLDKAGAIPICLPLSLAQPHPKSPSPLPLLSRCRSVVANPSIASPSVKHFAKLLVLTVGNLSLFLPGNSPSSSLYSFHGFRCIPWAPTAAGSTSPSSPRFRLSTRSIPTVLLLLILCRCSQSWFPQFSLITASSSPCRSSARVASRRRRASGHPPALAIPPSCSPC